jgi:hypothetical protein
VSLVSLIILVVVVGLVLWLVNAYIPMPPEYKRLINVLVMVLIVVYVIVVLLRMGGLA